MELLNPSYTYLNEMVMSMDSGVSANNFSRDYIRSSNSEWSKLLADVLYKFSNNNFNAVSLKIIKNSYERAIIHLLIKSLEGHPVLNELKLLEKHYFKAHEKQLDKHMLKLPYLSLIPLFLFLFPAYLILMLGPILNSLVMELSK